MANDTRAIIIATATNLLRWQGLAIIERGKATRLYWRPKTETDNAMRHRKPLAKIAKG